MAAASNSRVLVLLRGTLIATSRSLSTSIYTHGSSQALTSIPNCGSSSTSIFTRGSSQSLTSIPTSPPSSYRPFCSFIYPIPFHDEDSFDPFLDRFCKHGPTEFFYRDETEYKKVDKIIAEYPHVVCCFHGCFGRSMRHAPPIIHRMLQEEFPHVKVFHFIIDKHSEEDYADHVILSALNISSLPVFRFYKNGEKVAELAEDSYVRFKKCLDEHYNPDPTFGDIPDSHGEPVESETCAENTLSEDTFEVIERGLSPQHISTKVDIRQREFVISEIQDISDKLSSIRPLVKILNHRDDIISALDALKGPMLAIGLGTVEFNWLSGKIDQIFTLASQISQNGDEAVNEGSTINTALIQDYMVRWHEDYKAELNHLKSDLAICNKEHSNLEVSEQIVVEAEQEARKATVKACLLREARDASKSSLEKKLRSLNESSEKLSRLYQQLGKSPTEKLEKIIGSLKYFGKESP